MGADSPTKKCTLDGCSRPLRARGRCASHYIRDCQPKNHGVPAVCEHCRANYLASRRTQRFCSLLCRSGGEYAYVYTDDERRASREKQRRRRATLHAVEAEHVDERIVYDRDRWKCGICKRKVDAAIRWPDMQCASLDHIIPIVEHGPHTYANVRLTHLRCNVSRGRRGVTEQLALF